jgi:hypothetical protein
MTHGVDGSDGAEIPGAEARATSGPKRLEAE